MGLLTVWPSGAVNFTSRACGRACNSTLHPLPTPLRSECDHSCYNQSQCSSRTARSTMGTRAPLCTQSNTRSGSHGSLCYKTQRYDHSVLCHTRDKRLRDIPCQTTAAHRRSHSHRHQTEARRSTSCHIQSLRGACCGHKRYTHGSQAQWVQMPFLC